MNDRRTTASVEPTTAELSQEIWDKLLQWQERAVELGATKLPGDGTTRFMLSGNQGALRVTRFDDENFISVFWNTLLEAGSRNIHVYQDKVCYGRGVNDFPALDSVRGQALSDMLEASVVEVATPVQALYGFVAQDRLVALVYTSEIYQSSLTDREMLGLDIELNVVDGEAFGQICPANGDRAAWYSQFWQLQQRGSVVKLSERANSLPAEIWSRLDGKQLSFEFEAGDGQSPAFVVGEPYVLWHFASNSPASYKGKKNKDMKVPLRGWFK
jgi:hypothetical protein